MARFLHPDYFVSFRKYGTLFLALSGLLGFITGLFLYGSIDDTSLPLMYAVFECRVSIVDLMIPFILPFSVSAFAVYLDCPQVLPGVCFFKSAFHAFVSVWMFGIYGSAGWLIRSLAMFSSICHMILLFWYWYRHSSGKRRFSSLETASFACLAGLFSSMDYLLVIPVLGDILKL